MDVRKTLNENPMITGIGAVVIIVIAIWAAIHFTSRGEPEVAGTYYSTDDGATWFKTDTKENPPFDYKGQQAVRAHVYTCSDGKKFVGYLEKYTPEAKKVLDSLRAPRTPNQAPPDIGEMQMASMRGRMVKKPGDKDWVTGMDMQKLSQLTQVRCPDNSAAVPAQ